MQDTVCSITSFFFFKIDFFSNKPEKPANIMSPLLKLCLPWCFWNLCKICFLNNHIEGEEKKFYLSLIVQENIIFGKCFFNHAMFGLNHFVLDIYAFIVNAIICYHQCLVNLFRISFNECLKGRKTISHNIF